MVTLHQCCCSSAGARPPARNLGDVHPAGRLASLLPAAQPVLLPCLHRTLPTMYYVRSSELSQTNTAAAAAII